MRTVFGVILWIYWAACIITFFCIVTLLYLLTLPLDRYNKIPNRVLKGLAWIMLKINPYWSFEIKGADPEKISQPTIVVANHQSFLDMPLLYLLPWNMKWVAKKSLFKIPIFGWIIYMTGQIAIDRHSMRSAQKIDKLVEPIQNGIPAMIFPEGTRTKNGELKPFKKGAFKLARQYNFNILPVILDGGYQAMPPGSWKPDHKQHFNISILEPLSAGDYESDKEFKDKVYSLISEELETMRSK